MQLPELLPEDRDVLAQVGAAGDEGVVLGELGLAATAAGGERVEGHLSSLS
ncbi:hypothetical protein [Nocardioides litoris]|uniref:hypothetical protein n=1 Tax=Nocardioides litoris TaxID=1926648 RepID=UPI001477101F|nr:hypothetical protein [Nocardioides litoris]